jgi:hypothetical protein
VVHIKNFLASFDSDGISVIRARTGAFRFELQNGSRL